MKSQPFCPVQSFQVPPNLVTSGPLTNALLESSPSPCLGVPGAIGCEVVGRIPLVRRRPPAARKRERRRGLSCHCQSVWSIRDQA